MSIIQTVVCDGCGAEGAEGVSRDELHEAGWRVRAPGGKDFCPECRNVQPKHHTQALRRTLAEYRGWGVKP